MECRICGNSDNHKIHQATEMMLGIRDIHNYFECGQCGCLQIENIPENLAEYYPENYYSYSNIGSSNNPIKQFLIKQRDLYSTTGKGALGYLLHQFSPDEKLTTLQKAHINKDSKILDVGCGAGHLLHSLKDIGFTNLLGIDPFNTERIEHDNGLIIEKKSILEMDETWDLIMFHHSFEHIVEQQETLNKVHSLLNPGGTCLLRIPTVSSYAWQHYGVDWVQLDAPRHLFLHSINSVKELAQQTGFFVENILYDSNAFQFWGSEQYQKGIPLRDKRSYAEDPEHSIFTQKVISKFANQAKELNAMQQGDQAAFYLRKLT